MYMTPHQKAYATRRDGKTEVLSLYDESDIVEDVILLDRPPEHPEDGLAFESGGQADDYRYWLEVTYEMGGYGIARFRDSFYVICRQDFDIYPLKDMKE